VLREERLVAYVVSDAEASELRAYLKEQLPEYMVPGVVTFVDRIPLTANGKVDRKALPPPVREARAKSDGGESNQTVELLAGIWSELLRVSEVGAGDNFFALGGHSLLVMRLTSRIREVFGMELTPRTVFEAPTLGALAEAIEATQREGKGVAGVALLPVNRDEQLPLSYAQQRLWFLDQLQPGSIAYNIPGGVGMNDTVDVEALRASLQEVVRRHESLRTSFGVFEGEPMQVISD
jgi:acyl carrier protein